MRDNKNVKIRSFAPFLLAAVCLAQGNWQTATEVPGVDWHGVTGARRDAVLKLMREEKCSCGCDMKIAQCRMLDPSCGVSRKLASVAAKDISEGKTSEYARADIKKVSTEPPPLLEDPVKISIAGDPIRGPQNARVTLVEFSDFQCPFCSQAVPESKKILAKFPKDVRLVFKQFPLDSHSHAEFGAEAALAAQSQGKFWEMHDKLYAGFPDLSRNTVMKYAKEIGLDMKKFTSDLDSHRFQSRVHSEEQEGEVAGVGGTPTFFLNGKKYNGVFDVASLSPLIQKELK